MCVSIILLRARALLSCLISVRRETHPLCLLWLTTRVRVRGCFPVAHPPCTGAGRAGSGGIGAHHRKQIAKSLKPVGLWPQRSDISTFLNNLAPWRRDLTLCGFTTPLWKSRPAQNTKITPDQARSPTVRLYENLIQLWVFE